MRYKKSNHYVDTFRQFSKDFQRYVKENNIKKFGKGKGIEFEILIVTPNQLDNEEIYNLNKQLFDENNS
jgi:hypothetical protein